MGRPASSTIVLSPCSVSSFAAQPPEIPEPTTIASYVRGAMSDHRSERHVTLIAVEEHLRFENVLIDELRSEITVDREAFQSPERESRAGFICSRSVERRQQLGLLRGWKIDEARRSHRRRACIDVGKAGEKRGPFLVTRPLGQNQVDEFRDFYARRARRIRFRNNQLGDRRNKLLLSGIERSKRDIAEPAVNLFAQLDGGLRTTGYERQRERRAEESYDFTSSHAGDPGVDALLRRDVEPNVGRDTEPVKQLRKLLESSPPSGKSAAYLLRRAPELGLRGRCFVEIDFITV